MINIKSNNGNNKYNDKKGKKLSFLHLAFSSTFPLLLPCLPFPKSLLYFLLNVFLHLNLTFPFSSLSLDLNIAFSLFFHLFFLDLPISSPPFLLIPFLQLHSPVLPPLSINSYLSFLLHLFITFFFNLLSSLSSLSTYSFPSTVPSPSSYFLFPPAVPNLSFPYNKKRNIASCIRDPRRLAMIISSQSQFTRPSLRPPSACSSS